MSYFLKDFCVYFSFDHHITSVLDLIGFIYSLLVRDKKTEFM